MKILVLNGSPRPNGNTAAMVNAFAEGAKGNGHGQFHDRDERASDIGEDL
ncbi:hypothetical protein IMSAGC019_02443 [Lachnospiraceae bacterium]|nr:hypothetical protein IMSAGC019_02443 [Lachnospiraceae bacterium]